MTGEVGGTNSLPNAKAQDEARGVSAVNMNFKGPEGSFEMSAVLSGVAQDSEGRRGGWRCFSSSTRPSTFSWRPSGG